MKINLPPRYNRLFALERSESDMSTLGRGSNILVSCCLTTPSVTYDDLASSLPFFMSCIALMMFNATSYTSINKKEIKRKK